MLVAGIWDVRYSYAMQLLTAAIEPEFRRAGWFPNRSVAPYGSISPNHPAHDVLRAFGGLTVGRVEPGENCACSDIEFGVPPAEDDDIDAWQALLKSTFVGLGAVHHGHEQLWIDDRGRLFTSGIVAPLVVFLGSSFAEGIEKLLRGRRSQPMLLPRQEKVMAWGNWFSVNDEGVVTPAFFNIG